MTSREEAERSLAGAPKSLRVAYFAALLARASGLSPDGVIVVGGSAVEIYTQASYVSEDIDLVGDPKSMLPILKGWGFQKEARQLWYQPEWKLVVDLVNDLDHYNGSLARTRLVTTPYGGVRVEAVEDALVRRLIQAKYWKVRGEFDWAVALAKIEFGSIDWPYAEAYAKSELVHDLLTEVRKRAAIG